MTQSRATRRDASDRVRIEWTRRIEAEYRSAALTQELGHFLLVLGAPEWLVRDAVRITTDELAHARLSSAVATAAGNTAPPAIDRGSLSHARSGSEPLELATTRIVLEGYCLGETIAVRLFSAMRKDCDVPVARRALDRILKDEVRHRDFGWNALEWLVAIDVTGAIREHVKQLYPELVERQRQAYAPEGFENEKALPAADRRWGLIPGSIYASVTAATPKRDYQPRLKKLGLA